MAPEFGSTCGIFPIDEETIRYLELTGRTDRADRTGRGVCQGTGLWRTNGMPEPDYTDVLELDLATVEPSLAGPKRPQDRVPLRVAKAIYRKHLGPMVSRARDQEPSGDRQGVGHDRGGKTFEVGRRRRADRRDHQSAPTPRIPTC